MAMVFKLEIGFMQKIIHQQFIVTFSIEVYRKVLVVRGTMGASM